MNVLKSFNIPIKGALLGLHNYNFVVDNDFFNEFEFKPIENGEFEVELKLDKRPNLLDLEFEIRGKFISPCDRCLAEIEIPVVTTNRILVKYDDFGKEDTDEVIYISTDESHLQVAPLIFEFICLALPISKTLDCETNDYKYCDQEVLAKYEDMETESQTFQEEEKEERLGVWDKLKDIKLK